MGWTDEFPTAEESFFWVRHKQNHADINVGLLRDGTLLLAEGVSMSKSPRRDWEYLPASPLDSGHVAEFRRVASLTLKVLDDADYGLDIYSLAPSTRSAAKALREALK